MTNYIRAPILDLVDAFEEFVGYTVTNSVGHVVLCDYNLSDDNIESQLEWAEAHRTEWLNEPGDGVTKTDAEVVIAFLHFLKAIPEDVRTAHELDEDEDEPPTNPEPPLKSEDWLRRHGGGE